MRLKVRNPRFLAAPNVADVRTSNEPTEPPRKSCELCSTIIALREIMWNGSYLRLCQWCQELVYNIDSDDGHHYFGRYLSDGCSCHKCIESAANHQEYQVARRAERAS